MGHCHSVEAEYVVTPKQSLAAHLNSFTDKAQHDKTQQLEDQLRKMQMQNQMQMRLGLFFSFSLFLFLFIKYMQPPEQTELQRAQEAVRHMEEMKREVKRVAEENELQRAQEKMRQEQENMEIQEEVRRVQEESQRFQEYHRAEMQREAKKAAKENEFRRTQEATRQMQETMKMQEEIRRVQEENRKLQEKIRMEEGGGGMNELARKIEEDARMEVNKEVWLREEAERNLENGIPPVKYPTEDDFRVVRERLQYQEGNLHIAIAGVSGSGKSSLINAFRGYSSKHPDAAKTGTSETTGAIGRFCDPSRPWMFWYDVPGAGTPKVPDWQYFNDQGLFIFDILIIAVDIRFTRVDVALLFNCSRFGIPTFVVRSKADQHIANTIKDDHESGDEGGGDDKDSPQNTEQPFTVARNKFVQETRQEYSSTFTKVGVPPQKVYIVSNHSIRSVINSSKNPVDLIDEIELIKDILHAANERRRQD